MIKSKFLVAAACLSFAGTAGAQWWNPQDPTPPKYQGMGLGPKVVYTNALRQTARRVAWEALDKGEFEKLERMHDEFVRTALRATDGQWMLEALQSAVDGWLRNYDEPRPTRLIAAWREKMPASRLLPIAEAMMWQQQAWKARGGGMSGSITAEGRELFQEGLRKAARALEASAETGKNSPLWYWTALGVAGSAGRPDAELDALFEEAAAKFPTYLPLYLGRVNFLLPQWSGDYDKIEAFAQDAVKRTAATDGTSFYAWIYADVLPKHRGDRPFEETRVSWPKMRDSFEDILKRYPDDRNRLAFATFACVARDRESTARMFLALPPDIPMSNVIHGITKEGCRRLAFEQG
jgi:hypothetical protein